MNFFYYFCKNVHRYIIHDGIYSVFLFSQVLAVSLCKKNKNLNKKLMCVCVCVCVCVALIQ